MKSNNLFLNLNPIIVFDQIKYLLLIFLKWLITIFKNIQQ